MRQHPFRRDSCSSRHGHNSTTTAYTCQYAGPSPRATAELPRGGGRRRLPPRDSGNGSICSSNLFRPLLRLIPLRLLPNCYPLPYQRERGDSPSNALGGASIRKRQVNCPMTSPCGQDTSLASLKKWEESTGREEFSEHIAYGSWPYIRRSFSGLPPRKSLRSSSSKPFAGNVLRSLKAASHGGRYPN